MIRGLIALASSKGRHVTLIKLYLFTRAPRMGMVFCNFTM
jgi:hypothetical protein